MQYRYRETIYHIKVLQKTSGRTEASVTIDGVVQHGKMIPLIDDRREHSVEVNAEATVVSSSTLFQHQ